MRKILAAAALAVAAVSFAAPANAAHAQPQDTSWYCHIC